ncbi:MAG: twitching motility protein PilT, partial [Bacteroidales bacterium]|nr:twitching motility protein PilT [Bacteroidales bacterium]
MTRTEHTAWFRFYEELNDFLRNRLRKTEFPYRFYGSVNVKVAIEAIGVP